MPYVSFAAALIGGVLISLLNYFISKAMLVHKPDLYAVSTVLRQALSVGFLVGCYFIGENTCLSTIPLLIGAAVGVTVPSFLLMYRLMKLNQRSRGENTKGKEENKDG